jgi:acetyltransferase-like isoleucine patch superfamily enzyme
MAERQEASSRVTRIESPGGCRPPLREVPSIDGTFPCDGHRTGEDARGLDVRRARSGARRRAGAGSLFGPAVQIYTPLHPFDAEQRRREEYGKAIEIGSDVWVGGGAIILAGVRIGSRAVIGAGSVVTRDVPDGVFAAGNPCRVIRPIERP